MYESETHTCRIAVDGAITVDVKSMPTVTQTTITKDGQTVAQVPAAKLFRTGAFLRNEFVATYRGDGWWNVDHNAGFQRWLGTKSGQSVGRALRACGFDQATARRIMSEARKEIHHGMSRQF